MLRVTEREAWRRWLTEHSRSETEVWLLFYKKHTGRPRLPYDDAVEEALCFGWIDSIVKRIDDDSFAQKFTPRRDGSRWSALNARRVRKLIREGRMTEAGLAKIGALVPGEESIAQTNKGKLRFPANVKESLMANQKAWKAFQRLTPARQRAYLRLILDAKKDETRAQRVRDVIARLEQNTGEPGAIPPLVKQALEANPKAWENFRKLAPSYRRHYVGWILHAKKEETRQRRLNEAVALLEQNKKLGLK